MGRGADPLPESPPPALVGDRLRGPGRGWRGMGRSPTSRPRRAPPRPRADLATRPRSSLWNPGAPTVGPGPRFTEQPTLAQFVTTTPDVAVIAAKKMGFEGSPTQLSKQVQASVDPVTASSRSPGSGEDPQTAATVAERFSQGLVAYLKQLNNTQIDQQQQLIEHQVADARQNRAGTRSIIATIAGGSPSSINRTTPIPLTEFQRQPNVSAARARGAGGRLRSAGEPGAPRAPRVPLRAPGGDRPRAGARAVRYEDPLQLEQRRRRSGSRCWPRCRPSRAAAGRAW